MKFKKDWIESLIGEDPEEEGALDDFLTGRDWEDGLVVEHFFVFTDPDSAKIYGCHYYGGSDYYIARSGDDEGIHFNEPGSQFHKSLPPYPNSDTIECWPMEAYNVTITKYRKVT